MDGTKRANEPPAGVIRNVSIQNVLAHGTGMSAINGHPDSWLDDVQFGNVKLYVARDPQAHYEHTSAAMTLQQARKVVMKDVEIRWEQPQSTTWQTRLVVEQVKDLLLDSVDVAAAPGSAAPVVILKDAAKVTLRSARVAKLHVAGKQTNSIRLLQTETKTTADPDVATDALVRQ